LSMKLEEQIDFYNRYWSGYKPYGNYKISRIIRIMEYLNFIRKKKRFPEILDLGCGDGRSVAVWNLFGKASGLDLSDKAMSNASELFPGMEFISGDATDTDFQSNRFDVVISQEVIEHIDDQRKYIQECCRLLKQDGYLILTTPNKFYFDRLNGGNYSKQPVENILNYPQLKSLVETQFKILSAESIVVANGDSGIYKIISNKWLISFLNKLKLDFIRKELIRKFRCGVHLCILAKKK
jgi:SAM-dependent methyltransferase